MNEGIETIILHDELAFYGEYPVEWVRVPAAHSAYTLDAMDASNLTLLQACSATEEQRSRDKNDEVANTTPELARLELKLNLVLQMMTALTARQAAPLQLLPVRFNSKGATWSAVEPLPVVGEYGTLRIHLQPTLPQCLELAGRVTEVDGNNASLNYLRLSDACADQMQRFCFQRHRRQIAGARKSRMF